MALHKNHNHGLIIPKLMILSILMVSIIWADRSWAIDNLVFCQAPGNQAFVQVIPDDNDGVFLAWQDKRNGNMDIYAQYYSHTNKEKWAKNGLPVCVDYHRQQYPLIVKGDKGSLLILWQDDRHQKNAFYLQKISAEGKALWGPNGKKIADINLPITYPALASDEHGGCIILWQDISNKQEQVYALRVNGQGELPWGKNPRWIGTAGVEAGKPIIIPDSKGGAYIFWQHQSEEKNRLLAQRINGEGKPYWAPGGVVIKDVVNLILEIQAAPDGKAGAFITWEDATNFYYGIFAQHLSPEGKFLWDPQGVLAGSDPELLYNPKVISDSNSGIILVWQMEDMYQTHNKVYAQKLDSQGHPCWGKEALTLCHLQKIEILNMNLQPDGKGGALLAWQDCRKGSNDIYLQQLDAKGNPAWENNGRAISPTPYNQMYPKLAITATGEAYLAWWDLSKHLDMNIHGARINLREIQGAGALRKK